MIGKEINKLYKLYCSRCHQSYDSRKPHLCFFDESEVVCPLCHKGTIKVNQLSMSKTYTIEQIIEWFVKYRRWATGDSIDHIGNTNFENES